MCATSRLRVRRARWCPSSPFLVPFKWRRYTGGAIGATTTQEQGVVLECDHVAKSFAGLRAIQGVTLQVPQGKIVALIGPNGAGKTTLFNCITGFIPIDQGQIRFRGREINGRKPHEIARMGIIRTFQNIRMFQGLTVLESVLAAEYSRWHTGPLSAILRLPSYRREWRLMNGRAEELLGMLKLWQHRNKLAGGLPLLQQRRVEIARALAADPSLLMLDEPTAGSTVTEAAELLLVLHDLRQRGLTTFLIEHNMRFVMNVSDVVHVMNFGELVAVGSPDAVRADDVVRRIYLGKRA